MKQFKNFDEFFSHLVDSVIIGVDTYVFGYTIDDETDYQFQEENGCHEYYVDWFINLDRLQEKLAVMFYDEEEVKLSLDYVPYIDEEDKLRAYQRFFIFRSK